MFHYHLLIILSIFFQFFMMEASAESIPSIFAEKPALRLPAWLEILATSNHQQPLHITSIFSPSVWQLRQVPGPLSNSPSLRFFLTCAAMSTNAQHAWVCYLLSIRIERMAHTTRQMFAAMRSNLCNAQSLYLYRDMYACQEGKPRLSNDLITEKTGCCSNHLCMTKRTMGFIVYSYVVFCCDSVTSRIQWHAHARKPIIDAYTS